MKKIILGMVAIAALAACNEQDSNPTSAKPVPPTASEEGGISSGGGGTLPADPASVHQIRNHLRDAKRDLRLFFRNEKFSAQYHVSPTNLEKKIFLQKDSILEVLERTNIELLTDKACHDSAGNEVDGSIYASRPNTICISAFRIAPKVPKELARTEVLGLIAHELSHLVGADEDEAIEFQKNVVWSFKYYKVDEQTTGLLVDDLYNSVSRTQNGIADIIEKYDQLSDLELAKQLGAVVHNLAQFEAKRWTLPFSIYLKPQIDFMDIETTRLRVGLWFVSSQTGEKGSNYWRDQLDKIFQKDTELSMDDFFKRQFPGIGLTFGPNTWPQEKIKRVNSRAEYLPILTQLNSYFYDQMGYIWSYKFSNPFPKLLVGPWNQVTENPWKKFAGEYEVVSRQCTAKGYNDDILKTRTGFLIREEPSAGAMILRELFNNGWGESSLYDNGNVVLASAVVSVTGDATSAVRVAESGQTWSGRWSKSVETLQATDVGYIWKMRIDSKDEYTDKDNSADCTLTLKKK